MGDLDLHFTKWEDAESKHTKKVLALIHGFGDHSGHYKSIVEYFVPKEFTIYGFDYRGHGKSEGKRGHINSWEELRHDMSKFIRFLQEYEVGKDIFLFSNSAGGVVVLDFLLRNPSVAYGIKGLIVSGLGLSFHGFNGWIKNVLKASSIVVPSIHIGVHISPSALSQDDKVIKETDSDPLLTAKSTPRFFSEFFKTVSWVQDRASQVKVPFLMLQGGDDSVVDKEVNIKFFKEIPATDKRIHIYPGGYKIDHLLPPVSGTVT